MVTYLYEVVAFMLEIPEDEDEKEVERDHYNWQLVAPFNTLITVLIEAIGLVAGELAKTAAIGELKRECFTMDIALLLSLLTRFSLFTWLGLALLILCYYRSLSRNISKRTEENYQYYTLKDRIDRKFHSLKDQWANRKIYHYYRCPKCRQKLRVPRGRGRIQISCPRCGTQFIKKS